MVFETRRRAAGRLLAAGLTLCLLPAWDGAGRAAETGWVPVATELIAREKPGYGGLCGVVVDRRTGQVLVDLSDRGLYRSSDQGRSWERLSTEVKGRTETPGCLQLDPTGRTDRVLLPTVYGGPVAIGSKRDGAWKLFDARASHVDWCAIDWAHADGKLVLALKHESGGLLLRSRDGGASFAEVGKGYGTAWVFDDDTAVVAAKGPERPTGAILRSTDGGQSFRPCAEFSAVALPRPSGDSLYWLVQGGLLRTSDRGATWKKVCDLKDPQYGPVFGKTPAELFVLTRSGVIHSGDGGETWSAPLPLPDWKGSSPLTWVDYDPVHDLLYAMKMGSDLYQMSHPTPR